MKAFLLYLACISVVAAAATAADKLAAMRHARRVPEKTLFLLALLGGSAAMYLTMRLIRHKTRHKRFMIGLPVILAAQLLVLMFVAYRRGMLPWPTI